MRQLPSQLDSSLIAYIDLKNPASPIVHLPEQPGSLENSTPAPTRALNLILCPQKLEGIDSAGKIFTKIMGYKPRPCRTALFVLDYLP